MLAAFDKTTGKYVNNEQSWVGEPKWPEGVVVLEADKPWNKKVVAGKPVDDTEKIAARAVIEADREDEAAREKLIADKMNVLARAAAISALEAEGKLEGGKP